ncbi:MAG: hypothetical protein J6K32_08720 [Clostridia bacterium]|nr:hypothetical protein [Clostridia bacterium]
MNKTAETGAAKKNKKKVRKPLRRAKNWGSRVGSLVGRLVIVLIAMTVLGVLLSALQAIGNMTLRSVITFVVIGAMLAMYYAEGLREGAGDASWSRFYGKVEAGGKALTREEDAACYQPLKAVCVGAIMFGIPLVLAVINALLAKDYTYVMQDLPDWVTNSYGSRSDIMGPLSAYMQTDSMGADSYIRMIVRLLIMPYINLFSDPLKMTAQIDRLSPLFMLTYPIAYVIGYLCGPMTNEKNRKQERRAKKIAVRKAQKSNLAAELVGSGGEVHYGQQEKSAKKVKKELL